MWNLNEKIFWPCAKLSHGFLRGSYWNDWISPMRICRTTVNVTEVAKIAHKWIYRANWLFIHIVQWDSSPWCCQCIKDLHFRQNKVSITISISSNYNKSELKVRPSFCITSTFVILLFQTGILFFFFFGTQTVVGKKSSEKSYKRIKSTIYVVHVTSEAVLKLCMKKKKNHRYFFTLAGAHKSNMTPIKGY